MQIYTLGIEMDEVQTSLKFYEGIYELYELHVTKKVLFNSEKVEILRKF